MGDGSGPRHHDGDDDRPARAPRHLARQPLRTPKYVRIDGTPGEAHQVVPTRGTADPPVPTAPADTSTDRAPRPAGAPGDTGATGGDAPAAGSGTNPAPPPVGPTGGAGATGGDAPGPDPLLADTPRHGVPRFVPPRLVPADPTLPIGAHHPPTPIEPHAAPTPAPGLRPPAGAAIAGPVGAAHRDDETIAHARHDPGGRSGDGDSGHERRDGPRYLAPRYRQDDGRAGGPASSLRAAWAEAMWRQRSAPLSVRITAVVAVFSLVLMLIVGVSLALRPDDGPAEPAVTRSPATVPPTMATTTTVPPTTTTTVPPTTTTTVPPTTTTTVPPTTTTTAPPVVPPPTEAPTTTVPPTTTTTENVRYRDCYEAWRAGALPLFEGEPGYGPHLDRDGDGEACEWDERRPR